MNDLTVVSDKDGYHCPKCELEYEPDVVNIDPHCGRCGYDIGGTIDISTELTTEEDLRKKAGQRAKADLILIINNWFRGYRGILGDDVDWSMANDIMVEVIEQMLPYIDRLKKTGYVTARDIMDVGDHFANKIEEFQQVLLQNEELMRLTGRWDDDEQEIKDYWQKRISKTHRSIQGATRLSLPHE